VLDVGGNPLSVIRLSWSSGLSLSCREARLSAINLSSVVDAQLSTFRSAHRLDLSANSISGMFICLLVKKTLVKWSVQYNNVDIMPLLHVLSVFCLTRYFFLAELLWAVSPQVNTVEDICTDARSTIGYCHDNVVCLSVRQWRWILCVCG